MACDELSNAATVYIEICLQSMTPCLGRGERGN